MNNEQLARLQSLGQGEVTFEQLAQILPTESSYSEPEIDKLALSQHQLEQQKALARAIHQIRELLNLDDIFGTTTREVCQLLEADRVAVYRFTPNWGGEFVAEFVTPGWVKLVGPEITKIWEDTYLQETQGGRYPNNEIFTVDDIYKAGHQACHIELLEQFQARAYIIVPVLVKDRLWGFLGTYQNSGPRHWQPAAVNVLAQIGVQFGVAVLQAELLAEMQAEVTERKQAEQQYRTIFENAVEGIFQTTSDGHYLNANPALVEIFGYASPEELIANLTDIGRQLYVEPNRRTEFIDLMQKHKLVTEFEAQVYRKDGRMIWISENARAVYDPNDILLYYEGFVEEITERKQAEAAIRNALAKEKELSELKSHFVATTSHEFRTPLATILSSAELLRKYSHKMNEPQKLTQLQQIQTTVNHMTGLLNDLLFIGKSEAGKLEFNPAPMDLVRFCDSLVQEIQFNLSQLKRGDADHTIAFHSQGQCPDACMDEKLLRSILSNLLSNAIKYLPQGGTIHFDLICNPGEAIFHIQDGGIGIPVADQAKLFDSFHRASNVGAIAGTGLGLAIVKKSVDLSGGTIRVKSQVGVGTTLTVTIPLNNRTTTDD